MPPSDAEAIRKRARRLRLERAATARKNVTAQAELEAVRARVKALRALSRSIEARRQRNANDQG